MAGVSRVLDDMRKENEAIHAHSLADVLRTYARELLELKEGGMSLKAIVNRLADAGVNVSAHTLKTFLSKYRNGLEGPQKIKNRRVHPVLPERVFNHAGAGAEVIQKPENVSMDPNPSPLGAVEASAARTALVEKPVVPSKPGFSFKSDNSHFMEDDDQI